MHLGKLFRLGHVNHLLGLNVVRSLVWTVAISIFIHQGLLFNFLGICCVWRYSPAIAEQVVNCFIDTVIVLLVLFDFEGLRKGIKLSYSAIDNMGKFNCA